MYLHRGNPFFHGLRLLFLLVADGIPRGLQSLLYLLHLTRMLLHVRPQPVEDLQRLFGRCLPSREL